MKIILSPAKSLKLDTRLKSKGVPAFLEQSEQLIHKLRKLKVAEISKLMKVNPEIARLNHDRYQQWHLPFTNKNSYPAAAIFNGPAYQGLNFSEMSHNDHKYAQKCLRILSGLYGLIKPLNAIAPYRLEMGLSFSPSKKYKNLYQFWDDQLLNLLNQDLSREKRPVLINLASTEYSKAVKLNKIKAAIITPIFKDQSKSGKHKTIMAFAKKARGLMARFIIQNQIKNIQDLRAFELEGYSWSANESTEDMPVFIRDRQGS